MSNLREKIAAAGPFLRDIVFGVHDALLTNIGIVTGFVAAFQDNRLIVIAALIDVFISAFAMSFGTYLSRTSETEYLQKHEENDIADALANPVTASIVMWVTYVVSGMIPLIPFFFGIEATLAVRYGTILALIVFFLVGSFKGLLTHTSPWRSGGQFIAFGAVAALIGYIIGIYGQRLLSQ